MMTCCASVIARLLPWLGAPACVAALILAAPAAGASPSGRDDAKAGIPADRYHLFNPTPRQLMRPLSADRPDITESPFTVDPGHVQLELSFFDYVKDDDEDLEAWTIAPFNLKLGLLENVDVQVVLDPYVHLDEAEATSDGTGDLQVRVKMNLWGNDGGRTALALMPFVSFPTGSSGIGGEEFEGGLIVSLALELSDEWSLGLMAELDVVHDEESGEHEFEFVHSAALGRPIVGELAGYVEYVGIMGEGGAYNGLAGAGLTLALHEDAQLDGGLNLGLTKDAPDLNVFMGLTLRY